VFSCITSYIYQGNVLDVLTVCCQACTYKIHTHGFVLRKICVTCYTYQGNVWVVLTVCCQALVTFMTTVLSSAKVALLVNTYQGIVLNVFMICLATLGNVHFKFVKKRITVEYLFHSLILTLR
jgi:hypothetical protein